MAKPDLSKLYTDPKGVIFRQDGTGLAVVALGTPAERQVMKRIGGLFEARTILDLINPGPDWEIFGIITGIEDIVDLLIETKIYRNGQLLIGSADISQDSDFYFVDRNKIAFIFHIRKGEVLQISKNFKE